MIDAEKRRGFWIRAGAFAGFRELALELGYELEPVLRRFGIPREMQENPELQVPYAAACRMLEVCAEEWRCADLGLRLGRFQNLNVLGPLGLVARLTDTVGDALKGLGDRMNLHSTGFEMRLALLPPDGVWAAVAYAPHPGAGAGRQKLELAMSVVRNSIVLVSGNAGFTPKLVRFACPAPTDDTPARKFFRCTVRYGEEETAIIFRSELLAQPTAIRDPAIEPLVRRYLDQLLEEHRGDLVEGRPGIVRNPRKNLLVDCYDTENQLS
jgi:hypothetical protein